MSRRVLIVCSLPISILVVCLGAFTFYTIPLFTSPIQTLLESRTTTYDIDFERVGARWYPIENQIEVQFNQLQISDYRKDLFVIIPEVKARFNATAMFSGDLEVDHIWFLSADVNFIRAAAGAVKSNAGAGESDGSNILVKRILKAVFAVSTYFPEVIIKGTHISLHDEVSGAGIRIPKIIVKVRPVPLGVKSEIDIDIAVGDSSLYFSAISLYQISDQQFDLSLSFENERVGLLSNILPGMEYLKLLEVPVTGVIDIKLDKYLRVIDSRFDLYSGAGSLELIDYTGFNLGVTGMSALGNTSNGILRINMDRMEVDLKDVKVVLDGVLIQCKNTTGIDVNISLEKSSLSLLMPRWFAHLEHRFINSDQIRKVKEILTKLAFVGIYDKQKRIINGKGIITKKRIRGIDENGTNIIQNTSNLATVFFDVKGSIYESLGVVIESAARGDFLNRSKGAVAGLNISACN